MGLTCSSCRRTNKIRPGDITAAKCRDGRHIHTLNGAQILAVYFLCPQTGNNLPAAYGVNASQFGSSCGKCRIEIFLRVRVFFFQRELRADYDYRLCRIFQHAGKSAARPAQGICTVRYDEAVILSVIFFNTARYKLPVMRLQIRAVQIHDVIAVDTAVFFQLGQHIKHFLRRKSRYKTV